MLFSCAKLVGIPKNQSRTENVMWLLLQKLHWDKDKDLGSNPYCRRYAFSQLSKYYFEIQPELNINHYYKMIFKNVLQLFILK